MKGKRLLSMGLALATALTLLTAPASAVTFTDLSGHWAKDDVEYLANRGLVSGYSDGTFKPDANMSAVEALLFCARVADLDSSTKEAVTEAWSDTLSEIIDADMLTWAAPDLSVCLETGIITVEELSALSRNNALLKAIPREDVSLYLARAMQLAPVAEGLSSYTLTFEDEEEISSQYRPYIYLLNLYGLLKGDEFNCYNPQDPLNRASMTSLLRRALTFMEDQGITVELPNYTSYDWVGGLITAVNVSSGGVTQLTLESPLTGTHAVSVPANAEIYESNMLSSGSALKVGSYARANLNGSGVVTQVRVSGAVETVEGTVSALENDVLTVNTGTQVRSFRVDRFTEVQVGKRTGGLELLEEDGGYTDAVCRVDGLGHLASVVLTGGTRQESGIIADVTVNSNGVGTIQISDMSGVKTRYTLSSSTVVTINGVAGTLSSNREGDYVTLRVSNDEDDRVLSLNVDSVTQYVQASIKGVSYAQSPSKITVTDLESGKSVTYTIASRAEIRYNGDTTALSKLENGSFVTLRLNGTEVAAIDAYPGSTTDSGTITAITYGIPTLLELTRDDGTAASYEIDLSDPPDVYRDDARSSIDRLKNGDQVEITIRYQEVSRIDAVPQSANASGTITSVTIDAQGTTIAVNLTGGGSASYLVSEGISVTQNGKAVSIDSLKPGYQISMVVDGDQILSIEVDRSSQSSNQINATVLYVNRDEKEILVQRTDSTGTTTAMTVDVSDATLLTVSGSSLSLREIEVGDPVTIYGSYDGLTFQATLLIRN